MNTQQLESFLAVAENLSFARAAETLNITQSAVSRQIHALEDELDARLFRRTSRSVSFTPAGLGFYEDAKKFMHDLEIATSKIKSHSSSNPQLLSMGLCSDADCVCCTELLRLCREQIPEIHPFLRIIPHRLIFNSFLQGNIDVMFGFRDSLTASAGISYIELYRAPVCCALPASHPLAERKKIREADLYTGRIILCGAYSLPSQASEIQNRMKQHFLPEDICFCDNTSVLLTLVKAGYGFGIVPRINGFDPDLRLIPFVPEQTVSYGLFYNETIPNPVTDRFLSVMRKANANGTILSGKEASL